MFKFDRPVIRALLFVLLVFTPLARAGVKPWAVTVMEMIVLVAAALWVSGRILDPILNPIMDPIIDPIIDPAGGRFKTPLDRPLAAAVALAFISALFSENPIAGLWAVAEFITYIAVFHLTVHTLRTRAQVKALVGLLAGMGALLCVFGLFKHWGMNPFPWWDYADIGRYNVRLSATFGSPDHFAGYLEMVAALTLGHLFTGVGMERRMLLTSLLVLFLAALILTLSRGGWIGLGAGLFFMMGVLLTQERFGKYRWSAAVGLGVLVLMLILLSSTPAVERVLTLRDGEAALGGRLTAWQGVLAMIAQNPLLGTGPGTFADAFTQYQPPGLSRQFTMAHNDYLHFIAETGLPMALVMAWILVAVYRTGLEKMRHPSRLVRGTTLGALAGITAMAVHSAGDFNLHIPANALLFTVLGAVVCSRTPSALPESPGFRSGDSVSSATPIPLNRT